MKNLLWTLVLGAAALSGCASQSTSTQSTAAAPAKSDAKPTASAPTKAPMAKRAPVVGWLNWRGPQQNGTSLETNLPDKWEVGDKTTLWTLDLCGRGTPVVTGGRVYAWGYRGERENLQEVLACLDEQTGKTIWEKTFTDYLSDVVYDRYAIGAPTIDAETGNIYLLTTPGDLICFTPDGKQIWERAMMEDFGRLTFPNGRTGAPAIDGNLVIVNTISTNWGGEGPPRNRFYAFDKTTGEPVWSSTPGVGPPFLKDSSFSTPIFAYDPDGRRVFYAGIGSGALVCINAKTGDPLWRYQVAIGGVNSSPVLYGDKVIEIHGVQNIDSTETGRLFCVDPHAKASKTDAGAPTMGKDAQVWQASLSMFTSSPVIVGNRVYQLTDTGELACVDADNGKILWKKKLAPDQIHASPLWADGKLYVPMNNGTFYILRPSDEGVEVLSKTQLDGFCLGSPAVWNGKIYVFTTKHLYCFGAKDNKAHLPPAVAATPEPKAGPITQLQAMPSEVVLKPGGSQKFTVHALDAKGYSAGEVSKLSWEKFIPPTAKVKAEMDAMFNAKGELAATANAKESAGAYRATALELPGAPADATKKVQGTIRGRVLEGLPIKEDFESFDLTEDHPTDKVKFAYPPLDWIGARFKWDIREKDGSKVFAKTLDNLILQRATTFIGPSDLSDYTMQADLMTDGNRRVASDVGLINQRYMITLKGSHGIIEVTSNYERLMVTKPFDMKPGTWYTLKTRVDANKDGSGVVKAKAWPRGSDEPAEWTIEVPVEHAHTHGSPGLFGFALQNKFSVYVDNISITANK